MQKLAFYMGSSGVGALYAFRYIRSKYRRSLHYCIDFKCNCHRNVLIRRHSFDKVLFRELLTGEDYTVHIDTEGF